MKEWTKKNWRNKICFTPPKKFWGLPRTVGTAGTNRDYEPGWCLLRCVVRVSPVLILLLRVSAPTHIFAESGLVAAARVALPAPSRHQLPASEVIGDPVTVFSVEAGPASARHWSGAPPWREDSVMQWPGPEQLSAGPRTHLWCPARGRAPAPVWDILGPVLAEVLGLELQWLENTVIVMKLGQRRGDGRDDSSGGEGDGGALIPRPAPPPWWWWWCATLGSEHESSMLQPSRTADGSVGARTVDSGVLETRYPVWPSRYLADRATSLVTASLNTADQNVFIKDECDSSAVTCQPQDWLGNGDKLGALAKNSLQYCKCNTYSTGCSRKHKLF